MPNGPQMPPRKCWEDQDTGVISCCQHAPGVELLCYPSLTMQLFLICQWTHLWSAHRALPRSLPLCLRQSWGYPPLESAHLNRDTTWPQPPVLTGLSVFLCSDCIPQCSALLHHLGDKCHYGTEKATYDTGDESSGFEVWLTLTGCAEDGNANAFIWNSGVSISIVWRISDLTD